MTELKPCPFCGGEVTIANYGDYLSIIAKGTDPRNSCRCRLFMESEKFTENDTEAKQRAEDSLIEKWNRRANGWHTGTPTDECIDEYNEYCFALMFFYDRWWLSDYLFRANFEEGCFETAPNDGMEVVKFRFDEKLIWQKIEPYKEKKNG